ncbi:MAG TPA: NAD(P)H-hydrate dehydratase [Candidatus Margulisiibacteriota bacterium]|nr:NAD(P)H-hydrate dehydratase [Candidatus Margulisiibacteriota bacterium]
MILVTAAEMRRLDALTIERYGTPGHVLMERAGAGATAVLLAQFPHVRRRGVVIVAGKGNNGGDGFVIARWLRRKGVKAEVVLLGKPQDVKGDAARMLAMLKRARVPLTEARAAREVAKLPERFTGAALLVDAVFGTGLNADVQGLAADVLHLMNTCGVPIFAVDIPSGLDADRGAPLGVAIQAEATATFGFAKIGQVVYPGVDHVGALAVVDIGIADEAVAEVRPRTRLLDADEVRPLVPVRAAESHKGSCGHVLIFAGSRGHTGAARLAAYAACRSGAGLTTLAGPASLNAIFASGVPEAMTACLDDVDGFVRFDEAQVRALLEGKTAIILGPGLGTHEDARKLVRFVLREVALPTVVDADALTCIAGDSGMLTGARAQTILTPHPGEMARLLGSDSAAVQADRIATACGYAARYQCVVVLKGARSVIAAPDESLWINSTGNPGMASGGMGDALSGILGALLAQGLSPAEAACLGVYVHGEVADHVAAVRGQIGLLASDIIDGVSAGFSRLRL